MVEQNNQQKKRFHEIKKRMAKIRRACQEQHARAHTGNYSIPETYAQARLAGDYHMFDYDPDKEDSLEEQKQDYAEGMTPGLVDNNKLNPPQVGFLVGFGFRK